MELSRAIVCASLRQVYSLHGRCGPLSGAFSTPRSSPAVVGVLVPFAWSSCLRRGDGLGNWALLHLLQEVRRCCISRALRPRQQEWVEGWVRRNDTLVRGLPILVGGASLVAVLLNRAVSGIAAVADASRSACACEHPELMRFGCTNHLFCSPLNSSQSRADILTLALSVTDILAGLVWLSIRPKSISPVRNEIMNHISFILNPLF
jgi:hypothetical protein